MPVCICVPIFSSLPPSVWAQRSREIGVDSQPRDIEREKKGRESAGER